MAEFERRANNCGVNVEEFIVGGAASAPWTGSGNDVEGDDNTIDGGINRTSCEATNGAGDAAADAAAAAAVVAAAAAAAFGLVEAGVTMTGACEDGRAGEAPTELLALMLLKTLLSSSPI